MPCFKDATVQLHIERVRAMPVLSVADGDLPVRAMFSLVPC